MLTRSALESSDPGASDGGPNLQIWHFGADWAAFEVAGLPGRNLESRDRGIRDSGPSDFKSSQIGPKVSETIVFRFITNF